MKGRKRRAKMAAMSLSIKLGIASSILVAVFIVSPFGVGWIFAIASIVLAVLAARRGSRWWLLVPSTIVLMYVFIAAFIIIGRIYHLAD